MGQAVKEVWICVSSLMYWNPTKQTAGGYAVALSMRFPKGHPLAHDFAKQSVVCYTFCRRCRFKCRCRRGGQGHLKRQENRTVIA